MAFIDFGIRPAPFTMKGVDAHFMAVRIAYGNMSFCEA